MILVFLYFHFRNSVLKHKHDWIQLGFSKSDRNSLKWLLLSTRNFLIFLETINSKRTGKRTSARVNFGTKFRLISTQINFGTRSPFTWCRYQSNFRSPQLGAEVTPAEHRLPRSEPISRHVRQKGNISVQEWLNAL